MKMSNLFESQKEKYQKESKTKHNQKLKLKKLSRWACLYMGAREPQDIPSTLTWRSLQGRCVSKGVKGSPPGCVMKLSQSSWFARGTRPTPGDSAKLWQVLPWQTGQHPRCST